MADDETATRPTAREAAHGHFTYKEGNGCEMVVRALARVGQRLEHSVRCDQDTEFLEARDRSHAAELGEVAELVRAWAKTVPGFRSWPTAGALDAWLRRYDERTRKGTR